VANNRGSSVYYVVSDLISPSQDLYVVEFERHRGDLGFSCIVRVNCEILAKLKAWRPWPEYKRLAERTRVYLLDYAEIDWELGRCFVAKREKRAAIPVFFAERVDVGHSVGPYALDSPSKLIIVHKMVDYHPQDG
jgi:hypothetical protein